MANKNLFANTRKEEVRNPVADTINEAGGYAYKLDNRHHLAQMVCTGTFNNTYYSKDSEQLETFLRLLENEKSTSFIAKLALYRNKNFMKDTSAACVLEVSKRDPALFRRIFSKVIDNGKMLRTFTQMLLSGKFGRKCFSYSLKSAFNEWFNTEHVGKLLAAMIGNNPTMRDIMRLARPKPVNNERRALFGFMIGAEKNRWSPATFSDLPREARDLVAYRNASSAEEQVSILQRNHFRWDMLADAAKDQKVWKQIALTCMGHQALRMNLNTLQRHNVLDDMEVVDYVANRLSDPDEISKARQFPYQYFTAYLNMENSLPYKLKNALSQAAEIACSNVPQLPLPVVIGLDVSGSMQSPVTGSRGAGTSKMRCVDVAALIAAAILRVNPDSVVIPFDTQAFMVNIDPGDKITSLAERLAKYGGGGTECGLPIKAGYISYHKKKFGGVILVSDNESWVCGTNRYGATSTLDAWNKFHDNQRKLGNHNAKLVCINLQPYGTTVAPDRKEIMNIGGFSDSVFHVISGFMEGDGGARFVKEIESIEL